MVVSLVATVGAAEWGVAPDSVAQELTVFFAEGGFAEVDDRQVAE
nr:hypothetical protein [Micromonospora phaseoli]